MRIAVTGITGSFGRAFTRRASRESFLDRLVGVSRDELKQSEMAVEFAGVNQLRLFLGDVRDERRMREAFHGCDVVVHAAALKRVDATCYSPTELVKTNIDGTVNVVQAAADAGARKVLLISSDKACMPLNIYGASKLMAEQIAVNMNSYVHPRGTHVSALRYGNVLGSRGSVAHIWRTQAASKQPLTITDKRMTRFVLTIGQAVEYALQAIRVMQGGEIFVPILPSARIGDLATAIVGKQCPVKYVGLREGGEKLQEALLTNEEPSRTRKRDGFYVVTPASASWRAGGWTGEPVPPSLTYVSDGGHGWVGVEQLKVLLAEGQ